MSDHPRIFDPASWGETTSREDMDAAIKAQVIPYLRGLGFKGSTPHFRRERGGATEVLTFDFFKAGGNFCIELCRIQSGGFIFHGRRIDPKGYKASYTKERHRLGGPLELFGPDHWFDYGDRAASDVATWVLEEFARPGLWEFVGTLEVHKGHEEGWVMEAPPPTKWRS